MLRIRCVTLWKRGSSQESEPKCKGDRRIQLRMKEDWAEIFSRGKETPVRVHLIGVAGSGMSGLASLFMALGHRVSGSDKVTTGETDRVGISAVVDRVCAAVEEKRKECTP